MFKYRVIIGYLHHLMLANHFYNAKTATTALVFLKLDKKIMDKFTDRRVDFLGLYLSFSQFRNALSLDYFDLSLPISQTLVFSP